MLGDVSMSPGTITALAAIFGSLVGALGSSVSTWVTQRHQDRRDLLAREIFLKNAHLSVMYPDFRYVLPPAEGRLLRVPRRISEV
jgi:hypothetical protein